MQISREDINQLTGGGGAAAPGDVGGADVGPEHCPNGWHWNYQRKKCVKDNPGGGGGGPKDCPTGYHWDAKSKKCVKDGEGHGCQPPAGGCPADMHWDASRCKCVRDQPGGCQEGTHWDPVKNKCVPDPKCGPNQHWDPAQKKCVQNARDCPAGQHWDEAKAKCVKDADGAHPCPHGKHWDPEQRRCVADEEHPCGPGTKWDEEQRRCVPDPGDDTSNADIRDLLLAFLQENELCPDQACTEPLAFITQSLSEGKSYNQIIAELRQTEWYKAAYPENDIRHTNGFSFMPESQIRAYRNEARRIAQNVLGIDTNNNEIANLIGGNVSLTEWEDRLHTWKDFQKWGPTVRSVLEEELGIRIPNDRIFAFLDPSVSTPELDKAYEDALYRGRPAALGLGIRPQDEANMLRRFGIDVDQAFRGYQGIVSEMPRAERLSAIESQISGQGNLPPNGSALFNDTPFATLFAAIQLGDADAIRRLQDQMAREVARFQGAGGAVMQGGQAVGLLTAGERAQG